MLVEHSKETVGIKNKAVAVKIKNLTGGFQDILNNFGIIGAEEIYFHRYDDGDWLVEIVTKDREVIRASGPFNTVCIEAVNKLNNIVSNCIVMRF